jgi:hypothetical protein
MSSIFTISKPTSSNSQYQASGQSSDEMYNAVEFIARFGMMKAYIEVMKTARDRRCLLFRGRRVYSLQFQRVRRRSTLLHEIDQSTNDGNSIGGALQSTCGECSIHRVSASSRAPCFSFIPSSIKKIPTRSAMCCLKLCLGRWRRASRRNCSISRCKSL